MEAGSGLIEFVLVEARDLVAADLSGTSDPFVVVKFGDITRTRVGLSISVFTLF